MCLKCAMSELGSERVTRWEHPARARAPARARRAFVARVCMCRQGAPLMSLDCARKKETSSCSVRHPPHARVIHERRLESQLDEETPERRDPVRGCAAPSRGGGETREGGRRVITRSQKIRLLADRKNAYNRPPYGYGEFYSPP